MKVYVLEWEYPHDDHGVSRVHRTLESAQAGVANWRPWGDDAEGRRI